MSSRVSGKAAARERVATMRMERARAARRRRILLASSAIGVVLVLVLGLVLARAAGLGTGGTDNKATTAEGPAPAGAGVVRDVTSVPPATLDAVGAGTVLNPPSPIDAPDLTENGRPKVLYVGAEYCPFCAVERWPVIVALSRFGTWSGLGATFSAIDDVYPRTPTLSFHGATYTSEHLVFTGVETSGNTIVDGGYAPLDQLTPADQRTFDSYNRPPYTPGSAGGIPFLDVAGRYVSSGASYDPELLAGKSRAEIAAALSNPADPVAQAVNGSANVLTAAICDATGGQPAAVCTAPGVTAAAPALEAARQR